MAKPQQFQILHISDLHIDEKDNFDRSVVLNPLIDRVKQDLEQGFKPEIVVVSGDIANKGLSSEYKLAKGFFDDLLASLGLENHRIFIVPGNHDVDREKYRPSDIPKYKTMRELNNELENKNFRADLLKGMDAYFSFIETNYPHLQNIDERLIPFVQEYRAKCGKRIGLIGLNSAWMCRKSPDKEEIAIGEYQMNLAMKELKGDFDLVFTIFHHPLQWLWSHDRERNRHFLNDKIILCGHLHKTAGGYYRDLDGNLYQFQAGGAYLGSESNWPARFHFITFDWKENLIRLNFRKFVKEKRKWSIDSETSDDGQKILPMMDIDTNTPLKSQTKIKKIERESIQEEFFKKYTRSALNEHRHLANRGFETNLRVPIELERVYINMHAHIRAYDFDYTLSGKEVYKQWLRDEQLSSLDIKAAFKNAEKRNIKDIVVLGDPGSGKTTLLKYILVMLIQGKGEEKIGLSSDIIPFFAPLRELKDPDGESFLAFIKRVCRLDEFSIPDNALKKLLDRGRAIILLDGLDEVADENTRIKTCKWLDDARKHYAGTHFVVTSRFAGYLGQSRLEGNCMELSVQDFTDEEIEAFLTRWFETVETMLHPSEDDTFWKEKGREDARILVARIIESKHLRKLAVNPLLLQIIALVHRDRRGTLPQRRVELYEECTNVLLEKWDMAKGLDVLISAREARQVLQPLALWLHEKDERRSASMEKIAQVIEDPLQDIGKSGIDPETLLLNIRDRSGIFMGYSETQYGFTHLGFQEYLAAEQIRNIGNIQMLMEKYGVKWWKEVILLCLALDNPSVIEDFMHRIIPTDPFKTDISLVLDAIGDSIKKPVQPFADALNKADMTPEARTNAVRILKFMGTDKAIQALKKAATGKDRTLARVAFETLESLEAAEGIEAPVAQDIQKQIISTIDQAPMVLIPAGTFLYGSREDDKVARSNEKPQRVIDLPAFYMDVYPVTNEQFCAFLNAASPNKKTLEQWINLKGRYENERCRIKAQKGIYIIEQGYARHPIIYVSWHGAHAYARWAGKRLPTEQEWEKAARGTDGLIYPWGQKFDKKLSNSSESGINGTSSVDRFSDGKSPYGCLDMAGNVWEWTHSLYDEKEEWKVLRGGSWIFASYFCRCAYRLSYRPDLRNFVFGFRCART